MSKKKKKLSPIYLRLGVVSTEELLDIIPLNPISKLPSKKEFFKEVVTLTSQRYKVYAVKGTTCVHCGLHGTFFALEKSYAQDTKKYHFNLYGVNKRGEEIMITVDHIIPKSKGGSESLENKQPLCITCNNKKGDKLEK